jgi:UDP-glucose 4-epimerase
MKVLVTGSAGHLGEALVRALRDLKYEVVGVDIRESPFTTKVCSCMTIRSCVFPTKGGNHTKRKIKYAKV